MKMQWHMYLWVILIIFLIVIPARRAWQLRRVRISKRNRFKRRKGENTMNELVKGYIGKEVIVWAGSSATPTTSAAYRNIRETRTARKKPS